MANTVLENMWKEAVVDLFEDTVPVFSLIVGKM
jgi:hypothetical protein